MRPICRTRNLGSNVPAHSRCQRVPDQTVNGIWRLAEGHYARRRGSVRYFLTSEVWFGVRSEGHQPSRSERALAALIHQPIKINTVTSIFLTDD
jgi:hypothetical protein